MGVAENPESNILPTEDLVYRVCPLVLYAAHPTTFGTLLDVFVQLMAKSSESARILIELFELLLVILRWGVY